jgi:3-ketosteroid 9alpha-monooxygenase subunit A
MDQVRTIDAGTPPARFYCDVADIEPDMVARFEFEIDTTRAVAGWEAEVAENLARATREGLGGAAPLASGADAG